MNAIRALPQQLALAIVALATLALVALVIALALRHHPIIHVNCDHICDYTRDDLNKK
jgi:hypothetical protein